MVKLAYTLVKTLLICPSEVLSSCDFGSDLVLKLYHVELQGYNFLIPFVQHFFSLSLFEYYRLLGTLLSKPTIGNIPPV